MDSLPGGFIDWNTLSLDEMVKYLKEKYKIFLLIIG
jgi:hypothetical protein